MKHSALMTAFTVLSFGLTPIASADAHSPPEVAGTEVTFSVDPLPEGLHRAGFELWIPASLGDDEPVRAVIAAPLYQADRLIYELPAWRAFASEQKAVLLRHDMTATVRGVRGRLPIEMHAVEAIDTALAHFAQELARPELAHAAIVWTGLSQGGWQTTWLSSRAPERSIAAVAIHGGALPPDNERLPVHDVPTLFQLGQRDWVTAYVYPDVVGALHHRPLWTALFRPGLPHHLLGDPGFVLLWLGEVMSQRLPETIPRDHPPVLRTIRYGDGWSGTLRVNERFFVITAEVEPMVNAPADQRPGYWLPSEAVAKAWVTATLSGRIDGHAEHEEIAVHATRLTQPPVIDGQLDEWPELTDARWPAQVLPNGLAWRGPDDAAMRFAVGFDNTAVYLAIEVHDDEHLMQGKAPWSKDQDGIEVRIDARPAAVRMSNVGLREGRGFLMFAVGPDTENGDHQVVRAGVPDDAQIKASIDGSVYRVEARLPSTYFDEHQGQPWERFRLNIAVNDDDPDGRSQLWWRPDWRTDMNTFGSGTVQRTGTQR